MLFFERLLKYKLHRNTSKESQPQSGLCKVCSWTDVVYTSVNVQKIMFVYRCSLYFSKRSKT